MSNRVNQIRVWSKVFGHCGVFERNSFSIYTTSSGAASYIFALNTEKRGDEGIFESGEYFLKVEVGNDKGWVTYQVDPEHNFTELQNSLITAMEMHLGFYDEGESDKENAA